MHLLKNLIRVTLVYKALFFFLQESLKYGTNEPVYKKRIRLTDIENRLMVAKGEEGRSGMDGGFGVGR